MQNRILIVEGELYIIAHTASWQVVANNQQISIQDLLLLALVGNLHAPHVKVLMCICALNNIGINRQLYLHVLIATAEQVLVAQHFYLCIVQHIVDGLFRTEGLVHSVQLILIVIGVNERSINGDLREAFAYLLLRDGHGDVLEINLVEHICGLEPPPSIFPADVLKHVGAAVRIGFAKPAEAEGIALCFKGHVPLFGSRVILWTHQEALAIEANRCWRNHSSSSKAIRRTLDSFRSRSRTFAQILCQSVQDLRM